MIHFCFLDDMCRDYFDGSRVWRVHIDTRWFHLGIAFTPGSRYADRERPRWIVWERD